MRFIIQLLWMGLLCLQTEPVIAQSGKRVALLIGNAAYQTERPLRNPVNDAELLAMVLRDTLKFDDVRVERNLDVDHMDQAINDFIGRARGADSIVFYYSGHAMKKSANDRRNFLLPVDVRVGVPGARDLERQAIDAQRVRDRLRDLGARVTLLVLDACRDGPGGGKSGDKGLARMGGGNQVLVAYATEEDQVAADGNGRNSPYAAALARALHRPEPLLSQLDWVADEVARLQPGQHPTRDGNLRADAWLGNPATPVTPAGRDRIEDEAWTLCKVASTVAPCEDYLSNWPTGRYVAIARTRMRELQLQVRAPALASASAAHQTQANQGGQGGESPEAVRQRPSAAALAAARAAALGEVPSREVPSAMSPGPSFRDCAACPEMVVVPGGTFLMGSPGSEKGRNIDEGPQRQVSIRRFALAKYVVTQEQWRAVMGNSRTFVFGCGDQCPVAVGWNDAQEFIKKLNAKTGKTYRLPSEAEFEYSARAGTRSAYPWGEAIGKNHANCKGCGSKWDNKGTAPVGSFAPNLFGLFEMSGNVPQWVQDCYDENAYGGVAPSDGSAYGRSGCSMRVLRGGGFFNEPKQIRSASRARLEPDRLHIIFGFRLAMSLP